MFSIEGKTAFITGGTAGIGLATAKRLAAAGARVAIVGRRDGDAIAEEFGGVFIRADVVDEDQLKSAFDAAESQFGKLDIIFNNAGISDAGTIEKTDVDALQRLIDINVKPGYNGLRYGPRHMNDGGSIVNIGSTGGLLGFPGFSRYGATKASVLYFTKSAAMELAPRNIRVNAINPGSIWSESDEENESTDARGLSAHEDHAGRRWLAWRLSASSTVTPPFATASKHCWRPPMRRCELFRTRRLRIVATPTLIMDSKR